MPFDKIMYVSANICLFDRPSSGLNINNKHNVIIVPWWDNKRHLLSIINQDSRAGVRIFS